MQLSRSGLSFILTCTVSIILDLFLVTLLHRVWLRNSESPCYTLPLRFHWLAGSHPTSDWLLPFTRSFFHFLSGYLIGVRDSDSSLTHENTFHVFLFIRSLCVCLSNQRNQYAFIFIFDLFSLSLFPYVFVESIRSSVFC